MQKDYFHNNKSLIKNNYKKKSAQVVKAEIKNVVNINILLNRVKMEEKNQKKKKILFFSSTILALSLFGAFIVMAK